MKGTLPTGMRPVAERLDDLIRVSESEDQEPVSQRAVVEVVGAPRRDYYPQVDPRF
jgi:hypothetical protein